MTLVVRPDSPRTPAATELLHASHAFSAALYKPEENYVLSVDDLCAPEIRFFTAQLDGQIVGTVALALRDGYGEVKSMFVADSARGRGVGGALVRRVLAEGAVRRLPVLLETGPSNTDAMALYDRHGFVRRGPFGDYPDSPASVFFGRPAPEPRRVHPSEDMAPIHALLMRSFAYMEGVIDPPSSMNRLGLTELARNAETAELWVIEPGPMACVILTDKGDTLYLGKLAVDEALRGAGLSRLMVDLAVERARALGRPSVTLEVRVELTGNQAAFQAMGFTETDRKAHAGYDRPTSITYQRRV